MSTQGITEEKATVQLMETNVANSSILDLNNQFMSTLSNLEKSDANLQTSNFVQPSITLSPKSFNDVLASLQSLILNQNKSNNETEECLLPVLQELDKLSLTSYSLTYFISHCLPNEQTVNVLLPINKSTSAWLADLFRFPNCGVFYTENMIFSYEKVILLALNRKFGPEYFQSHTNPIIYCTPDPVLIGTIKRAISQIGLSEKCIQIIPNVSNALYPYKADVEEFENIIKGDVENNKKPLIVFGRAGAHVTGQMDDISKLKELCNKYNVWLHLSGDNLSGLALASSKSLSTPLADSMTLTPSIWLNISGLPVVTLFEKQSGSTEILNIYMSKSLPIWTCFQVLGLDALVHRIQKKFEICHRIYNLVSRYDCLRILCEIQGHIDESSEENIGNIIASKDNLPELLHSLSSCLIIQFAPKDCTVKVSSYYDKLNSWLGQVLEREIPEAPLELCEIENIGVVVSFSPFTILNSLITEDDWETFSICLDQHIEILQATVDHKDKLMNLITELPSLEFVEVDDWAGLGAVRYIPQQWQISDQQLATDQAKQDLNRLNIRIVQQLRSIDAAFSLGEGSDGLACVRFGMVTADTDVAELLSLVQSTGIKEEESSKYIDSMAELVKKGIETATVDLKKESEDKIWQEGILRHVPVFGSLVNWWSPPTKNATRGRWLDLEAGVVRSTEIIYEKKAQKDEIENKQKDSQIVPPFESQ
ncbi:pyridoxal-dependent decarboxylase domain-containing protein 1 [Daktulosphaira vitifoliae]|uniref:pyridoxal-dependent decarboxylase domain-containing protein 1 n=1 Tax=Daktulosphaira vitifoliae TaxID=58002 RepID=UPI0021A9AE1F|nr:pyridoxal-dependent decarboxylase domain-containing protein 1 [Daktulosphaira vitifoliae]